MAYRILEVTLISASDLKNVTIFPKCMRVYAAASITGGDSLIPTHSTNSDRQGGRNPTWNAVRHFPIPTSADPRRLALHVLLRSEGIFFGHREVGEVIVALEDLLAAADSAGEATSVSYQVLRANSSRTHGVLYFRYKVSELSSGAATASSSTAAAPERKDGQYLQYVKDSENAAPNPLLPYGGYTPQSQPAAMAYPPTYAAVYPPVPYGYAPPQMPYGYNAAPYGYNGGAPPPYANNAVQPPPAYYPAPQQHMAAPATTTKRRGIGMGAGAGIGLGLLGGAVGGMMLGEMAGELQAEAAYDAGVDDALEF